MHTLCSIAAAVIVFLAYDVYMMVFSFYSGAEPNIGIISLIVKRICAVVGVASFVTFLFMGILAAFVCICMGSCAWVWGSATPKKSIRDF